MKIIGGFFKLIIWIVVILISIAIIIAAVEVKREWDETYGIAQGAFFYTEEADGKSLGVYALRDRHTTYIEIPESVDGKKVVSVGEDSFRRCDNLKDVKFANSVRTIKNYAFEDCKTLKQVVLPESLETIGAGVFKGCEGLQSVVMFDSVSSIGRDAFEGCTSLTDIYYCGSEAQWNKIYFYSPIPDGVTVHYNYNP